MIDFTRGDKRFIAGRGMLQVFNASTGEKIMGAIDVFRDEDPTPERCIECYKTLTEIAERLQQKPKQTKAITKDPF